MDPLQPLTPLPEVAPSSYCMPVSNASSQTPINTTSAQSMHSISRSQRQLKEILAKELHDAVFESPSLLHSVFPLTDNVKIDKAIDQLASELFSHSSPPRKQKRQEQRRHSTLITQLNPVEKRNYPVLRDIFNRITGIAKEHSTFYPEINFDIYDKAMMDKADGQRTLKPDLVAIHGKTTGEAYEWRKISIAVEVKSSWGEGLKQAATYGRSMLEQDKRWFSIVIVYNNAQKKLRFCFFNRVGLFTTPSMSLTEVEGFKAISHGLIGIIGRHDASIDKHHVGCDPLSDMYLPACNGRGHWFKVTDVLCQRIVIRGRATHVYRVKLVTKETHENIFEQLDPSLAQASPHSTVGPNSSKGADEAILCNEAPDIGACQWTTSILSSDCMADVVIKVSWPLQDRADLEATMFTEVKDRHGIPDVAGTVIYYDTILEDFAHLTDLELCRDFPKVYSDSTAACPRPQLRSLVRMVYGTQGTTLEGIADWQPKQLVKILLDSMIGHMECFLKGYLHRDISVGNVLTRAEPQVRTPDLMGKNSPLLKEDRFTFLQSYLTSCSGFIIDGDQAIKWRQARIPAKHRSGTLPFISHRVLEAWADDKIVMHTAIDDLESFVWVLVWVALQQSEAKTSIEKKWHSVLSSDNITSVADRKFAILAIEDDEVNPKDYSTPLLEVFPLLSIWFKVALAGRKEANRFLRQWPSNKGSDDDSLLLKLQNLCVEYYIKYLSAAVEFLDNYT